MDSSGFSLVDGFLMALSGAIRGGKAISPREPDLRIPELCPLFSSIGAGGAGFDV